MKISEIAEAAGTSTSRIRFYEKRGLIPAAKRSGNGYRDYSGDVVDRLRFIEQAQSLGFTLREIAEAKPRPGLHRVTCDQIIPLLEEKCRVVSGQIAEAENRKQKILSLLETLQAASRGV
ncbi:MAG TPA: MerR family transcriptional regulator [Dongiaceae bacterium]|nr:MerR family transcriptional regulator [Dongiaceae bacterium]